MSLDDSLRQLRRNMDGLTDALGRFDPRSPEEKLRERLIDALIGLRPFIDRAEEELNKIARAQSPEAAEEPPAS